MTGSRELYPLTFEPKLLDKIWGGRRLESVLGKDLPPKVLVGESWEAYGGSVVANGRYAGRTVDSLIPELRDDLVGRNVWAAYGEYFPLLFKYLDAEEYLSVQVHPDDEYARQHEENPRGKAEAWYIVHAEPGAQLVHGWEHPVTAEEVESAVGENRLEELLEYVEVFPGDVIDVPAGTVHAIGGGILLAEIQQNSDTTYRLYDWDRNRELHIQESIDTLEYGTIEQHKTPPRELSTDDLRYVILLETPYFVLEKLAGETPHESRVNSNRFELISSLESPITLEWDGGTMTLAKGQTALLPAGLDRWKLVPDGHYSLLRMYPPGPRGAST